MRINTHNRKFKLFALLGAIWFCLGAASFPSDVFRMKEFDKAREDDLFNVPIPETVDVPKVKRRKYDLEEEERRLPVTGVIIEGVVPYPELGITQEEIQLEINKKLREVQATDRDINGFTNRDLEDIGAYLSSIIDRGGVRGGVDRDDIVDLLNMITTQRVQDDWISLAQLDSIALTVTEYYRDRGFILATAFIPEQEVSDGKIRLNVLEGRLGNVIVSNNKIYDSEVISAAFDGVIGEAVTEQRIESALRRINDLPGVQVRGSFRPGDNVGETTLNLGVLSEKSWGSNVLVDNHGSETTGVTRVFATTEWLNLRKKGHRLLVGVLRSEGPDSSTYGLVDYEMPIFKNGRGKFKVGASTNVFSVAASNTIPEIIGETDNFTLTSTYQYIRSRTRNLSGQASFTYKDVLFNVGGISSLSTDQQLGVYSLSVDFTQLWDDKQLLLSSRFGLQQGKIIAGEIRDQDVNFTKVVASINLLKRFEAVNWFTLRNSSYNFVFKANVQYAEKFLSSVEQFSLGGPTAVRAFGVSDVSVDSGAYAGVELFFDIPFDPIGKLDAMFNLPFDPIKPFVFLDYAYGVALRPGGGDGKDARILGYGLGFRVNWSGKGTANLIFATPKFSQFDDDFSNAQGKSRVYFDVNYQIH